MMELIERLINKNKPFLIIKYGVVFSDMANNCYELVTIDHNHRLHFAPIERQVAIKAIHRFRLPLLHEMDKRNMIWGDERFKEKYGRYK
jgi:hypothetical protein